MIFVEFCLMFSHVLIKLECSLILICSCMSDPRLHPLVTYNAVIQLNFAYVVFLMIVFY